MEQSTKTLDLNKDFPPISTEQWEALILNDLKGADYEKKLIWKTSEGFRIKPYYRAEDLANLTTPNTLPCQAPFVRGNKKDSNNWIIKQHILESNPEKANKKAMEALNKGAECVSLNVSECKNANDITKLLNGIDLEKTTIHFYGASSYIQLSKLLIDAAQILNYDPKLLKGSYNFDCLGYYVVHSKFYASLESNFVELADLMELVKREMPLLKIININAHKIHNLGGSISQELAYALSMGVTYLTHLISKGISVDDIANRIEFTFAVGSNYFLEISKIRAVRMLWSAIIDAYAPKNESSQYMYINSISSVWNKTIFDPHVNILRSTTEAMSAAIGGCDTLSILPFDITYKNPNTFSERIARNLQIILKEEAYFDKVIDVSAGSYYIENLTETISKGTWKLFLEIENNGGFVEFLTSGKFQDTLEKTRSEKLDDLANRKQVLLGINQYPNSEEFMLDKIEPKNQPEHLSKKETRLSQQFEALKLSTEDFIKKGNEAPKVFLLAFGNLAMRKARAGFSLNFFACAGYNILDNNGFHSAEEGISEALKSKAQIIVLCSSDEEYATLGLEITEGLKKQAPEKLIVVAGNPKEAIDALSKAGVNNFIHMRSNVLNTLTSFNKALGIN